jgi:hypothetical protein
MSSNPIVSAIDVVADHVEKYADNSAWDVHKQPSEDERAERRSEILAVVGKLRDLSKAADARKISGSEFDALIEELRATDLRHLWQPRRGPCTRGATRRCLM